METKTSNLPNSHLVDEIIDQEATSARARRHRLGDPGEMRQFAELLASHAPSGMTVSALRWCYQTLRTETGVKMTPSHLHNLWRRYRNGGAVAATIITQPTQKRLPHRYSAIIAHRLMRAMGLSGNNDMTPLMPGEEVILDKPPTQDEASEFFACGSPDQIKAWRCDPRNPYASFEPQQQPETNDWPNW